MRFSKEELVVLVFIIVALVAAGWYTLTVLNRNAESLPPSSASSALLPEAGAAGYTDLYGNPVSLSDHIGKVLVVTSWASWCPPCAQSLPQLNQLAKKYTSEDVVFLAINRAELGVKAQRFLEVTSATDRLQLVLDSDDHYYRTIGGYSMPELVVYDRMGAIVHHARGALTVPLIGSYIDDVLATQAAPDPTVIDN